MPVVAGAGAGAGSFLAQAPRPIATAASAMMVRIFMMSSFPPFFASRRGEGS